MENVVKRQLGYVAAVVMFGVPFALWGFDDLFVLADGMLALGTALALMGMDRGLRVARVAAWCDAVGIGHAMRFVSGVIVLLAVAGRQWLQVGGYEWVAATAVSHPDIRLRYAVVTNLAYLFGWGMLLASAWPRVGVRAWYRAHRRDIQLVAVMCGFALGIRLLWLNDYPNIINGDEGLIGWWARGMLRDFGPLEYTLSAMDGVGTFYLTVLRGLIWLFGSEVWVLRFLPALAGSASIATVFLLTRSLYGTRIAVYTALALLTTHTHLHFSRQVAVSYIYAAVFLPLLLWGVWQMVTTRRARPAIVAAAAVSFHANFYVDAWAWLVLSGLILAAWLLVQRAWVWEARQAIAVYAITALCGFGPQLVWAAHMPSGFFSRLAVDGSFTTGYVQREAALLQTTVVSYVLFLYDMALQALYATPFIDFYHADVPILDPVSVGLALIGAVLLHNRLHTPRSIMLLGWFWGGVTALAVFTLPISTYHYRLFVIVPVLAIAMALGADAVYRVLTKFTTGRIAHGVLGVVFAVVAYTNTDIYVQRLALDCRYGGDHMTQRAGAAARFLKEKNVTNGTVIIVGLLEDMHAGTWKSFEYLNETLQFENAFPGEATPRRSAPGSDVYFLYIPERFGERARVEAGFPQVAPVETITMCGEVFGYLTHTRAP